MRMFNIRWAILFVIFVGNTPVFADESNCTEMRNSALENTTDHFGVLYSLYSTAKCFGSNEDKEDWVVDIRKKVTKEDELKLVGIEKENLIRKQWAIDVIDAVGSQTVNLQLKPDVIKQFKQVLAIAKEQLLADVQDKNVTSTGHWQLSGDNGTLLALPLVTLKQDLDKVCKNHSQGIDKNKCDKVVAYAEELLRMIYVVESAMQYYGHPVIEALSKRYTLRKKMWDAYRDNALPQYWWEWGINSWRLSRSDDRLRDAKGQPMGPMEIPNDQIILLHPAFGIERLESIDGFSTTDPTIIIEFLGYNRWRWNRATGEMQNGLGFSVIGSYADRSKVDDFSYGILVHFQNKYSIAVTRSSEDDTGILLTVDLATLFREKSDAFKELSSNKFR
ncbi:MAG: hypothetical protein QNL62_26000 [Gammaproteobacteria bacterium]|nr:hypothetical protein [Gammaproteobacteria bacterium]